MYFTPPYKLLLETFIYVFIISSVAYVFTPPYRWSLETFIYIYIFIISSGGYVFYSTLQVVIRNIYMCVYYILRKLCILFHITRGY